MAGEVTERDRVNTALDAALEVANSTGTASERAAAVTLVRCTEALVHQIRDLDDDAFHLREAIVSSLSDLTVVVNGQG